MRVVGIFRHKQRLCCTSVFLLDARSIRQNSPLGQTETAIFQDYGLCLAIYGNAVLNTAAVEQEHISATNSPYVV